MTWYLFVLFAAFENKIALDLYIRCFDHKSTTYTFSVLKIRKDNIRAVLICLVFQFYLSHF